MSINCVGIYRLRESSSTLEYVRMRIIIPTTYNPSAGQFGIGAYAPINPNPGPVLWDWTNPVHAGVTLLMARQLGLIPSDRAGFEQVLDRFLRALSQECARGYSPLYGSTFAEGGLAITVDRHDPVNHILKLSIALDITTIAGMTLSELHRCSNEELLAGQQTVLDLARAMVEPGGDYAAMKTEHGQRTIVSPPKPGYNFIATVVLLVEDDETNIEVDVPVSAPSLGLAAYVTSDDVARAVGGRGAYDDYIVRAIRAMTDEEYRRYNPSPTAGE